MKLKIKNSVKKTRNIGVILPLNLEHGVHQKSEKYLRKKIKTETQNNFNKEFDK